MKTKIIIILLISNFTFGQNAKVAIDRNLVKYEIDDEFERFDDIDYPVNEFKSLNFKFNSDSDLEIKNSYGGGFIGYDISFRINNLLEIDEVYYNFWTDNIDLENVITYKVRKAYLSLNQNPFDKLNGLRGKYILEIEHYCNDSMFNEEIFKGKFKTFEGIDKTSADYKWALNQNQIRYNIINADGVYLNPPVPPTLKSDTKTLIREIKKIKGHPRNLRAMVVINEQGKIEKEPIRFYEQLDKNLESKIIKLLIELTDWNPAFDNGKKVKSQVPIMIGLE